MTAALLDEVVTVEEDDDFSFDSLESAGGTLRIPEEYVGRVPCQDPATRPLFITLDLDVDLDDPDYLSMSQAEKRAKHAAKIVAEEAAVEACQACPMLDACRTWALQASVHGVAGGLTEGQRKGAVAQSQLFLQRGEVAARRAHRGSNPLGSRHSLLAHEVPNANIRTPLPRGLKPAPKLAESDVDFDALTPETLMVYAALSRNGGSMDRKELVEIVAAEVDEDVALRWGRVLRCAEEKKQAQGAAKFARNRIDLMYRKGRLVRSNTGVSVRYGLPARLAESYRAWASSQG